MRSVMRELLHKHTYREDFNLMATSEDIEHVFSYHPPTPEQAADLTELRLHMKAAAHAIQKLAPESPYRTVAFRKLHEANMYANVSIVLQGRSLK